MSNSIFMDWLGGFPLDALIPLGAESFEVVSLILYARWLLVIGVFLLAVGYDGEGKDKMEQLACYRYGTALSWWKSRFWKGLLAGMQKALCLMAVFLLLDLVTGRGPFLRAFAKEAVRIGILWLVHAISLDALFLLLELKRGKGYVPAAVLLAEGLTFYIGYRISAVTNIMYGTWGMYLRSDWFDTRGFPAETVLIVELLLAAAGYYGGRVYLKKARCAGN